MIQVLIKPTMDSLREESDVFDGDDDEALLFEQGFEGDCMDVEDGETFIINENYVGELLLEEDEPLELHPIIDGIDLYPSAGGLLTNGDELQAGRYELQGVTIRKIENADYSIDDVSALLGGNM